MRSLNCIKIDCENIDRCCTTVESKYLSEKVAHFEIPQLCFDYGLDQSIDYIGTTDRQNHFIIYTDLDLMNYHKYRKRGLSRPFVYLDPTPNSNNYNDCYVFNAPYIEYVSAVFIPKDPRQLKSYIYTYCKDCETDLLESDSTYLNNEIKKRLTEKKIRYYRLQQTPVLPSDQAPA
ncbi:MAG: hypothetical protein Nk1A_8690 [Endomicrobiia bacterium]|nr:MAG: hypothetical protein Nk1A_8690 [Endomicrobiia bacterium]